MPETTERPVSSLPAYSARPTVRIDGQPLATVDQQLRTMTVSEAEVCCSHRCNRPTRHAFNSGKPASNSSVTK